MKKNAQKYLLLFLTMGLLFTSCNNDDDIVPEPEQEEEEEQQPQEPTATLADYPVQDFMWRAMNLFYFWQADVPNLADNKFTGPDDPEYVSFLASEDDPALFYFRDLCFQHERILGEGSGIDRFSGLRENYKDLVNALQGIFKSNGLEFNLYSDDEGATVYGVVTYIMPDSDASTRDIKRGDVFNGVNGQNLNGNNFRELLFGDDDSYVLNMADFVDNVPVGNGREVTLNKIENFSENPILVNKVIERGNSKIGYLVYNGFLAAYDDELNNVFGEFASEGIDDLILDFRYNPGGRVSSAIQIASSVYKTDTTAVFLQPQVNKNLVDTFFGTPEKFTDVTIDSETPLNELGLSRVFVITSNRTASASELVINGLEPYVDVIQVGQPTRGKSEFSNTLVDDPETAYLYNPEREEFINPNNQWGLQPLLGKNANADGFSAFENGLQPDHEISEIITELGVLGEENERLLAKVLSVIDGETAKGSFDYAEPANYLTDSKMFLPAGNDMFMDGLLKPVFK